MIETSYNLLSFLYEYTFQGGLSKGGTWGGHECSQAVPFSTHILELAIWSVVLYTAGIFLEIKQHFNGMQHQIKISVMNHKRNIFSTTSDIIFAVFHLGIWCIVLYYKICLKSLINLLQPCHILLLMQGYALLANDSTAAFFGSLSLPLITGAFGGLVIPATDGLDYPFEKELFFIQHYLMLITALFLLLRNNCISFQLLSFRTIAIGNYFVLLLHWFFFSVRT